MDEPKEPFDAIRACFWLVAGIIAAQLLFSYLTFGFCAVTIIYGAIPVGTCKDLQPSIFELLTGGMAVALAFSKGPTK